MSSPDDHPEAPAPDDAPRGDQEATWLITTPPPPPPPIGAPLAAPEQPRPAGPPPVLPTASTPPVHAPAPDPGGPAPEAGAGPAPPPPAAPAATAPPTPTPAGEATTQLAAQEGAAGGPAVVGPAFDSPTADQPTIGAEVPAGEPTGPGGPVGAAPGPEGPVFVPPGATTGGAGGESASDPDRSAARGHPLAGGTAAARSVWREVSDISPWHLASAAILVAFVVSWFAGILLSFRHVPGLTARARILQFFAPGTLGWALAVLLAIALFEVGRRLDPIPPVDAAQTASDAHQRKKRFVGVLPLGLFLAGAAVTVSALVGVLVELSNFGNGIDTAFSSLLSYLALVGIGAAETWLAFREYDKTPA